MDKSAQLISKLGPNKVKLDEVLANYTYMKVGGKADYLVTANNSGEVVDAVTVARSLQIPVTIMGSGANILIADSGIHGLVVLNRSHNYHFLPHDYLESESGVSVIELINQARG